MPLPRWEQVLEPLDSQLRPDGTVGPIRFSAVASRPILIRPVSLPAAPARTAAPQVADPVRPRTARDAMPVLGRLRLHLEYVRVSDRPEGGGTGVSISDRPWFRNEVQRQGRSRRRARPISGTHIAVPGSAPDAVGSLVEYFGLRAVSRALASVAATDHPARELTAIPLRTAVRPSAMSDTPPAAEATTGLSARERGARRGFYVA